MKYKNWEHLCNVLITITIIGGIITYFVETTYAMKYKMWVKKYFIPTSKKLFKELLKNQDAVEVIKEGVDTGVRKLLIDKNVSKKTKELIMTTTDKGLDKVIKKLS